MPRQQRAPQGRPKPQPQPQQPQPQPQQPQPQQEPQQEQWRRQLPCCPAPARESTPLGHSGEHTYAEDTEGAVYGRIAARFRGLERKLLGLESYQVRAAKAGSRESASLSAKV